MRKMATSRGFRLSCGAAVVLACLSLQGISSVSAGPQPPGGSNVRSISQTLEVGYLCLSGGCVMGDWRLATGTATWNVTIIHDRSNKSKPFVKATIKLSTAASKGYEINEWQWYHGTTSIALSECKSDGTRSPLSQSDEVTLLNARDYLLSSGKSGGRYQFASTLQQTPLAYGTFASAARFQVTITAKDSWVKGKDGYPLLNLAPLTDYDGDGAPDLFRVSTGCLTPR